MTLSLSIMIRDKVREWRENNYDCDFPVIAEILTYNFERDDQGVVSLRFLRKAQFEALETYWYLRLVEKTPKIIDLYKKVYGNNNSELLKALGINLNSDDLIRLLGQREGIESIFREIVNNDQFVRENKLESVRETITMDYPSFILALAMGSGKTILIASIIATEFAMEMEYPDSFVKNALVFAPGKTIVSALKEISDVPYEKILPQRLFSKFITSVKIIYTQDKEKDIPALKNSSFNLIVTNTEKIRIQTSAKRSRRLNLFNYKEKEKIKESMEVVNLRLLKLSSLPSLAIFSDEAHHTYGQALDKELKKVRRTVDYLAAKTDVITVVNTTGTPYYKKEMLKDVVYWYSLSQGITDGILKEVSGSIVSFENVSDKNFIDEVVKDFLVDYGEVKLYDGSRSKLAFYFPSINSLTESKPLVEMSVRDQGYDPSVILEVHSDSTESVKDLFNNRINDPEIPYRVFLLVNMGTEGWNCPSLFATALARKLKTSNNFVLQAASRCLRQVPGNVHKARIYLDKRNVGTLDTQLHETFGENLKTLDITKPEVVIDNIWIRKLEVPRILVKSKRKRIKVVENEDVILSLSIPEISKPEGKRYTYTVKDYLDNSRLLRTDEAKLISANNSYEDVYFVSTEFSANYRIDLLKVHKMLRNLYPNGSIPSQHVPELALQIEEQLQPYAEVEEDVETALAIIKYDGFDKSEANGEIVYTAEITYRKDRSPLVINKDNDHYKDSKFGFHYSPYNLDSNPEKDLFDSLLEALDQNPDEITDVYFTGGMTDPKKTDFIFEYKDKKGKWRTYTPDFVILKKSGKTLIVEVKAEIFRDELKEITIRKLEELNPEFLKYEIMITNTDQIGYENLKKALMWIYGDNNE